MIPNLVLSLKNNIHLDFYKRKLFVSPFSSNYHNSLLKRTVHGAYRACNKVYIKIPPSNPKYLPSGKKFPTLRGLFIESLGDDCYNYGIPRLTLWQTSEIKQSVVSAETLASIADEASALPSRITST